MISLAHKISETIDVYKKTIQSAIENQHSENKARLVVYTYNYLSCIFLDVSSTRHHPIANPETLHLNLTNPSHPSGV